MAVGAAYAAIAGILKVTARRERGRLDDHAQLHRHRDHAPSCWPSTSANPKASLVAETKPIPPSGVAPAAEPAARGVRLPPAHRHGAAGLPALRHPDRHPATTSSSGAPASASSCARRASTRRPPLAAGVNPKRDDPEDDHALGRRSPASIGLGPLLADPQLHKYGDTFPTAIGFTGIAVALLGRNSPGGIAIAAVVWAALERAGQSLPPIGVPQEIVQILQGHAAAVSAVIAFEVVRRFAAAAAVRDAARTVRPTGAPSRHRQERSA